MKKIASVHLLILAALLLLPLAAPAEQLPETIAEKMSVKLARGVTNFVTAPAEIPKQIVVTGRDMGTVGYIAVGPLKGIGMTLYRGFIGMVETIFFAVPQPGYYDSTIEPPYVWQGWDPKRDTSPIVSEETK